MQIGIIGLGRIGLGVARLALSAGHQVAAHDIRPLPDAELPPGLKLRESAAAVADASDATMIAVYDDAQVMAALTGEQGVLGVPRPGHVVTVLSTVEVNTVHQAGALAGSMGAALLDCGVSAGVAFSHGAKLAVAIGGDQPAVERIRPALESFGDPVVYMGELGSGMTAKLARNLLHYCSGLVDREAALLAARAGVDVGSFIAFVRGAELKGGGHMRYVTPAPDGGIAEPGLPPARYAVKDLHAALALGRELRLTLPAATLAEEIFRESAGS
jgi:3-hydroxyisobutyrate dehydrogenase-like beta-hydroxyacid dehydrogenase